MRIALVSEWIDPWRGGAETSTFQFAHHLTALGIEVELFTRSRTPSRPGMKVRTVRVPSPSRTGRTVLFLQRAARLIRQEEFDVVHAVAACPAADVYEPRGGLVAESIERNLALRHRGVKRNAKRLANYCNLKQRVMLSLERHLLRRDPPPTVIAISDYVARQLDTHYQFPQRGIHRVFNGVDPDTTDPASRREHRREVRSQYGIGDGELLALTVAHNLRLKGLGTWLEALAALSRGGGPVVHAVILGRDNPIQWQRRAASLGIGGRTHFAGPTRRVPAFLHAADFLVHPTFYDPCSRVVLEAITTGLPVITSRFDGAAEVLEDGCSGFVLPDPADAAALAERVVQMSRPETRDSMRRNLAPLTARITMHDHARRVLDLYRTLTPEKPQTCPTG